MNVNPTIAGAAPLVAAAIGRAINVTVEFSSTAKTAVANVVKKTITLPLLPVNLAEDVAKIVWGFIHHEAGHLRHTDPNVRMDNRQELRTDRLLDNLLGVLEDIRMERAHIRFYPGASRILAELVEVLVNIGFFKPIEPDADVNHAFFDFVLKHLRSTLLGQVALRDQADLSRECLEQQFGPGFVTRLVAELQPILTAENTTEALNVAYRIRQFLKDELDAQQNPPSPPQSGDDQGSADDSTSESSAGSAPQDADDDASSGSSDGSLPEDDTDDSSGGSDSSSTNSDGDDSSSDSSTTQGDDPSGDLEEALNQLLNSGDLDKSLGDLGDALVDELNKHVDADAAQPVALPKDDRRSYGTRDRNAIAKARSVSSRLAIQLKRQLESHNVVMAEPSTRGKRLSRRHLSRVAHKDYRIFTHREFAPEVNTAVVSLIDVSGSMSRTENGSSMSNVQIASQAILATSLALDTIPHLEHAVGAFPSSKGNNHIDVIQDFGDKPEPISSRFALSTRGNTPMAEALLWAADRLLQRAEERRIIFVATDGAPNDVTTTKSILEHLRRLNIEVHGLGIKTNDQNGLFDSFAEVHEVGALPQAFLALFQRVLRRSA